MIEITKEFISEILHYNPDTGVFRWKMRNIGKYFKNPRAVGVFNSLYAFTIAGSEVTSDRSVTSYIAIKINGKSHKAHRLAFIYMTGLAQQRLTP